MFFWTSANVGANLIIISSNNPPMMMEYSWIMTQYQWFTTSNDSLIDPKGEIVPLSHLWMRKKSERQAGLHTFPQNTLHVKWSKIFYVPCEASMILHGSQWLLKGWIPFLNAWKKRTEQDNQSCPAVPRVMAKQSKTFNLVLPGGVHQSMLNSCFFRSFSSFKWVSNGGSWYVNNIE